MFFPQNFWNVSWKAGQDRKKITESSFILSRWAQKIFPFDKSFGFQSFDSLCTNSLSNEMLISSTDLAGVLKTFIYLSRNPLLNENFICIFHPIFTCIPSQNSRQVLQHISTLRCPSSWFLTWPFSHTAHLERGENALSGNGENRHFFHKINSWDFVAG